MNKEQLEHYLKGGRFSAIYRPKKMDISGDAKTYIGNKIVVWQNMIITPIITPVDFRGQHAFNAGEIYGWFPEEDIEELEIIDEFIDDPQSLPQYMYQLYYSTEEQLSGNFGSNHGISLPFMVGREYSQEQDNYVKELSNPPADKIEKAIWNGEIYDDIKWEELK